MDTSPPDKTSGFALRRALAGVLSALRRVAASAFQIVFHDRLSDLQRQTQRLGSASVESNIHLGTEVRALGERLDAIERELAELRALLERQGRALPVEDSDEISARPHAG